MFGSPSFQSRAKRISTLCRCFASNIFCSSWWKRTAAATSAGSVSSASRIFTRLFAILLALRYWYTVAPFVMSLAATAA